MNKYVVPNLSKAVQMLKLLADAESGLSAQDLERRLEMPRTTVFRVLKTLMHEGMVEKRKTHYFAGVGLFEIGLHALRGAQLRETAVPLLQELTRTTGQTSHLAIPSGWHSLILEVCDSTGPLRVASRPGTLADLHCSATGKLFLTYLYPGRLAEFMAAVPPAQRTPKTRTTLEQIQAMIQQVRTRGFAWDDEEYHEGVRCLAAPVFDMGGEVVAALGITGPASHLTMDRLESDLGNTVCQTALRLSAALGYKLKPAGAGAINDSDRSLIRSMS